MPVGGGDKWSPPGLLLINARLSTVRVGVSVCLFQASSAPGDM